MSQDRIQRFEGPSEAQGLRVGIVVSRFNQFVTDRLLASAVETLMKAGAREADLTIVRVPGAFEIPLVARRLAHSRRFDTIICLGAVIRGETPHFEYISAEASRGIMQVSLDFDLPVIFGVLTTDTVQQALDRSSAPGQNRGADAARSAIEMANLMKQLQGSLTSKNADMPRSHTPRSKRGRRNL
jgi:6,7-dimethyl-8-ribityllumazine synthase